MAEVEDYSRCLMKQEYDDDLNIESDGSITGRGTARVTSIPHSQYGERCLSVTITTATSITFAITGEILSGSEFKAGTVFPWYRYLQNTYGDETYGYFSESESTQAARLSTTSLSTSVLKITIRRCSST